MDLEHLSPEGALTTKKSKQMFKTAIFSLAPRTEGPKGNLQIGYNLKKLISGVWSATMQV